MCGVTPCHGGISISPGRSSDFQINLLAAPSHSVVAEQWLVAAFVPDYSGGPVPEFNGVPYYAPKGTCTRILSLKQNTNHVKQ